MAWVLHRLCGNEATKVSIMGVHAYYISEEINYAYPILYKFECLMMICKWTMLCEEAQVLYGRVRRRSASSVGVGVGVGIYIHT